jgi:hypothetical protein
MRPILERSREQKRDQFMKKLEFQNLGRITAAATVIFGLAGGFTGQARAECGVAANQFTLVPRLSATTVPDAIAIGRDGEREAYALLTTAAPDPGPGGSIVGLWKTTFTSGGQVIDQGFDQWNSDGTEILNDEPPPQTGNVCLGVYVKAGPSYKLKHPSWTYDANGNLTGTAIIREQVTVRPDANTYQGTFTIDLYDLNGNHLGQFGGTIAATRIAVDF